MAHTRNQNDELLDKQLLEAILVLSEADRLRARIVRLLDESEPELERLVRRARTGLASAADYRRMRALIADMREVRREVWVDIERTLLDDMERLARDQTARMKEITKDAAERVRLAMNLPSAALLDKIVQNHELEGRTISDWIDVQRQNDDARLAAALQYGLMSREDPDKLVRRLFGEPTLLGKNGLTQTTRNRLGELVMMSAIFTEGEAKREFALVNPKLFDRELYLAVLDDRTTPICRSLNKRIFLIGEGPYPPLHWWCRSTRIFLFPGEDPQVPTSYDSWVATQSPAVQKMARQARAFKSKR